ncbi:MAG TPA: hypothetical protein VGL86_14870 [Polyangia bacterium]
MQHAADARTVEFQARHAAEARAMFEHAVTAARMRFEAAERRPTLASRVIARQSVASELYELAEFEERLMQIEEQVATAILANEARVFRRLRLAD